MDGRSVAGNARPVKPAESDTARKMQRATHARVADVSPAFCFDHQVPRFFHPQTKLGTDIFGRTFTALPSKAQTQCIVLRKRSCKLLIFNRRSRQARPCVRPPAKLHQFFLPTTEGPQSRLRMLNRMDKEIIGYCRHLPLFDLACLPG